MVVAAVMVVCSRNGWGRWDNHHHHLSSGLNSTRSSNTLPLLPLAVLVSLCHHRLLMYRLKLQFRRRARRRQHTLQLQLRRLCTLRRLPRVV